MSKYRAGLVDKSVGVKKGTWTEEEDLLLSNCVEMFGEGKWHQIPHRAGLNRCRKSCRLRWLNYLKPNINRGEFKEDEVDLMVRLHKLLGNRWSLIAGRLPGRTANDVKNYWNTHLRKKIFSQHEDGKDRAKKTTIVKAIRPRPRTFSKNLPWLRNTIVITDNINPAENLCKPIAAKPKQPQEDQVMWMENMLLGNDCDVFQSTTCSSISKNGYEGNNGTLERDLMGDAWGDKICWNDIFLDEALLDLFNDEQKVTNDVETLPV